MKKWFWGNLFGHEIKIFYHMIDSYKFGKVVVNGEEYEKDLIIFPDHVKSDWWRIEGHKLRDEDLKDVFLFSPDVLVVGKGAYGLMKISEEVEKALAERGIRLRARRTAEACDIYNALVKKGKRAVAALHLTC